MIEKNKNYSVAELKALLGNDWLKQLGIPNMPVVQNKPIINDFSEFDSQTAQIYQTIKNLVVSKNPGKTISVWATGSRVKGTWRTKEESEQRTYVKYSDYDYCTDGAIKPSKSEFQEILNVPVDHAGGQDKKVLIP